MNDNFKKWFGDSKVVDDEGNPLVVYHGTTHDYNIFDREKGNSDNDFGVGFYASSSLHDVHKNYLADGVDLTNKITNYSERLEENKGLDEKEAKRIAEEKFKGEAESIMPVYLSLQNPLILSDSWNDGTVLDFSEQYDEEDDSYEESEDLNEFYEAFQRAAWNHYDDFYGGWEDLWRKFTENNPEALEGEVKASNLVAALKNSYFIDDFDSNDDGGSKSFNFIQDIFKEMGYDGVIYMDASHHFKNMDIHPDTQHYVAFESNQIKSAIGNSGEYDPNNPDIVMKRGGQTPAQSHKIALVMGEFRDGSLKTSYGETVTDRKQAIAIALSEAGVEKREFGGSVKGYYTGELSFLNW
jgi:uncharacterized membrane protein YkoI